MHIIIKDDEDEVIMAEYANGIWHGPTSVILQVIQIMHGIANRPAHHFQEALGRIHFDKGELKMDPVTPVIRAIDVIGICGGKASVEIIKPGL